MPKMILVKWTDAVHLPMHWQPLTNYLNSAKEYSEKVNYTCGFLLEENNNYILVGLDFSDRSPSEPLINMAQLIHNNMIISMTDLEMKE